MKRKRKKNGRPEKGGGEKMEKMKKEAVRKIKDGTIIYNSKTGVWAMVFENFGGGLTLTAKINGKETKANMSYVQMYDMVNNKYTDILEAI